MAVPLISNVLKALDLYSGDSRVNQVTAHSTKMNGCHKAPINKITLYCGEIKASAITCICLDRGTLWMTIMVSASGLEAHNAFKLDKSEKETDDTMSFLVYIVYLV